MRQVGAAGRRGPGAPCAGGASRACRSDDGRPARPAGPVGRAGTVCVSQCNTMAGSASVAGVSACACACACACAYARACACACASFLRRSAPLMIAPAGPALPSASKRPHACRSCTRARARPRERGAAAFGSLQSSQARTALPHLCRASRRTRKRLRPVVPSPSYRLSAVQSEGLWRRQGRGLIFRQPLRRAGGGNLTRASLRLRHLTSGTLSHM